MKVLESCENPAQIETSEKLFELYLKRWGNDLNNAHITTFKSNFEKEKKNKLVAVRKKKSFFSKMSQLFLF